MAEPIAPNAAQLAYWQQHDGCPNMPVVIGGPEEAPDVIPCPALIAADRSTGTRIVHVAYRLNEIEVAALARGGTLWLTTWGGLPVHLVEVIR